MGPHPVTRTVSPTPTFTTPAGVQTDADRLTEGAFAGGDGLGQLVDEIGWPGDVLGESAVVRRGCHEFEVVTEVVIPALAGLTAPTRDVRFDRHIRPSYKIRDALSRPQRLRRRSRDPEGLVEASVFW